jgi:ribonuclease Z
MAKIVILGTANAIATENHDNTHLLIQNENRIVLVDCAGSPVPRLSRAGVQPDQLSDLLLTHFHPDHVAGAPLLLMDLWLLGRTRPLMVHGLEHTLTRLRRMLDLYDWDQWPGFFPIQFNIIPEEEYSPVIEDTEVNIWSSPVRHLLPTIGIRIEVSSGGSAAYSSDTEPCEEMIRLAEGVDVLIHESSGASMGHSSAEQAGEVAQKSGALSLALIHYPANAAGDALIQAARRKYSGPVRFVRDFDEIDL